MQTRACQWPVKTTRQARFVGSGVVPSQSGKGRQIRAPGEARAYFTDVPATCFSGERGAARRDRRASHFQWHTARLCGRIGAQATFNGTPRACAGVRRRNHTSSARDTAVRLGSPRRHFFLLSHARVSPARPRRARALRPQRPEMNPLTLCPPPRVSHARRVRPRPRGEPERRKGSTPRSVHLCTHAHAPAAALTPRSG